MNGRRFVQGLGYFVVKNDASPGVSCQEARLKEIEFFANALPWSTELVSHKGRFGTDNLRSALSEQLALQIKARLVLRLPRGALV